MRSMTLRAPAGRHDFGAFAAGGARPAAAGPAGNSAIMNVKTTDNRSGRTLMASIDPITGGGGG